MTATEDAKSINTSLWTATTQRVSVGRPRLNDILAAPTNTRNECREDCGAKVHNKANAVSWPFRGALLVDDSYRPIFAAWNNRAGEQVSWGGPFARPAQIADQGQNKVKQILGGT